MKIINTKTSLFELTTIYPEITDIMIELGFKDILKPGMLQSVGRVMNLDKGCKLKKIEIESIQEIFAKYGFNLEIE